MVVSQARASDLQPCGLGGHNHSMHTGGIHAHEKSLWNVLHCHHNSKTQHVHQSNSQHIVLSVREIILVCATMSSAQFLLGSYKETCLVPDTLSYPSRRCHIYDPRHNHTFPLIGQCDPTSSNYTHLSASNIRCTACSDFHHDNTEQENPNRENLSTEQTSTLEHRPASAKVDAHFGLVTALSPVISSKKSIKCILKIYAILSTSSCSQLQSTSLIKDGEKWANSSDVALVSCILIEFFTKVIRNDLIAARKNCKFHPNCKLFDVASRTSSLQGKKENKNE
ncbi:unnamed protein product [Albugo candida]|uniref:Uncharacterized protein n=1 Tax=Albugo candida TaxID=65357 RepID=A0A024GEM6_9STRA|nr:unnamed protein product [Albugo candida]|eukprot:CCI45324.1 unnamed protein product [Albugo candida]